MTTEECFKNKASKLEITQIESDKISNKHNKLREILREKLPVEDDFLTGSYSRSTLIRPKSDKEKFDVDFFLAFSNEDYGKKELPELLAIVKKALDEIKAEDEDIEEIKEQKRSIGVIYKDNFQIDVVPAIQIKKDELYKIFDKNTFKAISSNPKLHGEISTQANDKTESGSIKRLIPIVKLLKSWKRDKCDYMKSFHLEILTVEILKDEEIKSFAEGIAKFFSSAESYLQTASLNDPANKENIIDEYLDGDGTRDELLKLISNEKKIVTSALQLEKAENNDEAVKEWKKIFEKDDDKTNKGYSFPNGPVLVNRRPSKPWCDV